MKYFVINKLIIELNLIDCKKNQNYLLKGFAAARFLVL